MTDKTRKITALSLYALAFLCCVLATVMLLIPFNVTLKETVYAVPPGEYRTEITSDTSYYSKNFFYYIDYLELKSWSPDEEILLVVSLLVALGVSIALFAVQVIQFARKFALLNRGFRIALLAISIFSAVSLVSAIILQGDVSVWKMCGHESIYLSGYPGWSFYEETSVRGSVVLIPTIIFMFIAFFAQCGAGALNVLAKNPCLQNEYVEKEKGCDVAEEKREEGNRFVEKDLTEELIKYKKLLDNGIISQEEFDNKRKELLGM